MKLWYFQSDGGYLAVSSGCPRGVKAVVYLGTGTRPGGGLKEVMTNEPHEPEDEWPLLDDGGENLVAYIPVRRPAVPQPSEGQQWATLIACTIVVIVWVWLFGF